ncbi:MAG: CoA transferase subunit A [Desulfobacteraceae bacterium]
MAEKDKRMSMSEAVERYVYAGDTLHLGGFIQHEPFAAAHEIIRQNITDVTLSKNAGLVVSDQMIGAGLVKHLICSFTWNPLPATSHCFVRAVTKRIPRPIELEEYPLFVLNLAYFAGAMGLPYVAAKSAMGSGFDTDLNPSEARNRLRFCSSPFTGERVCLVPPIKHDVGIIQVQRCDPIGNAQAWGLMGESRYGIQSCERIIICAEEIVDSEIIMRDPNRTLVPSCRVSAVVEEPWGGHPAPVAGHYDLDWHYYAFYERQTRTPELFEAFMNKWVYGVRDRKDYLKLLGAERVEALRPEPFESGAVPYGRFPSHCEV